MYIRMWYSIFILILRCGVPVFEQWSKWVDCHYPSIHPQTVSCSIVSSLVWLCWTNCYESHHGSQCTFLGKYIFYSVINFMSFGLCWDFPRRFYWVCTFGGYIYPKHLSLHSWYTVFVLSVCAFFKTQTHDISISSIMLVCLSYMNTQCIVFLKLSIY